MNDVGRCVLLHSLLITIGSFLSLTPSLLSIPRYCTNRCSTDITQILATAQTQYLEKYIEIQAKIELTNSHGCVIITYAVVAIVVSQAKAPPEVIIPARYNSVLPDIFFIAD